MDDTGGVRDAQPSAALLYTLLPKKVWYPGTVEIVWRYIGAKYLYVFYGGGIYYISGWAWPMTLLEGSSVGLGSDRAGAGMGWVRRRYERGFPNPEIEGGRVD